jgi:sulfite reductase beta subunit-like hemoprotein
MTRPTDLDYRTAIEAHGKRVERFQRGELTNVEFTPIRLGYGLYYQLDHTSHMQRIKLPGGMLTAAQADCIAEIGEQHGRGVIHVTTRQDVQLHWIDLENVIEVYERLHAVGISTRGACADSIRNVTGCYHAGTIPGEPFDVTPYVYAVHEYSLFHPLNLTMPRKFKIAFAACAEDCVQARVNDIAFYAKVKDGREGFSVFAGGGLGSQPFMAIAVCDFIPAEDVLVMTEAILRIQHRAGERKNRKRARMKYLVKKMGTDGFVAAIEEEVARVEAECGPALRAELREVAGDFSLAAPSLPAASFVEPEDPELARWARTNLFVQKQEGYYGVTIQLPLGDCSPDQLRALAAVAREHGTGMLRTSNDQNLYLPWIPGDRIAAVYGVLKSIRLHAPDALHITDVVSCPGADFCSLAVSRSMGMAAAIRKHLLAANGAVERLGTFRIRISGCPNACGQHYVGDIGLTGLSVKGKDGAEIPHYSMLVGGMVGEDESALGERLGGKFAAEHVPEVIAALADYYGKERLGGESFGHFVRRVGTRPLSQVAQAATGAPLER